MAKDKYNNLNITIITMSVMEGILMGGLVSYLSKNVALPYLFILIGFYTALRAGRVNGWFYIPSIFIGSIAFKVMSRAELDQAISMAADFIVLPATVLVAYYLLSGANLFATYVVSPNAFGLTCFWSVISSIFVYLVNPETALVVAIPILWASLMPLWCFDLRVLHAPLFAAVYLLFYWLLSEIISPRIYPVNFAIDYLPNWIATLSLVLVPELIAFLRPERRHIPESRPVTSDPMSEWEKLKGMKEILLLAVSFYSMYMERFRVFRLLAPLGRYLMVLGIILEFFPLLGGWKPLSLWYTLLPVIIGILLELGLENYGAFSLWTVQYSLVLVFMRGLAFHGGRPGIFVLASVLLFLALILWFNRPTESNEKKKERWKELGRSPGRERVEL